MAKEPDGYLSCAARVHACKQAVGTRHVAKLCSRNRVVHRDEACIRLSSARRQNVGFELNEVLGFDSQVEQCLPEFGPIRCLGQGTIQRRRGEFAPAEHRTQLSQLVMPLNPQRRGSEEGIKLRLGLLPPAGRQTRGSKSEENRSVTGRETSRLFEQMLRRDTSFQSDARETMRDAGVGGIEASRGLKGTKRPLVLIQRTFEKALPLP